MYNVKGVTHSNDRELLPISVIPLHSVGHCGIFKRIIGFLAHTWYSNLLEQQAAVSILPTQHQTLDNGFLRS